MNRRAFSLIEVLVALAIFALAAVGLGAAYSNVLLGRQALKQYDVGAEDMARCRAALSRWAESRRNAVALSKDRVPRFAPVGGLTSPVRRRWSISISR